MRTSIILGLLFVAPSLHAQDAECTVGAAIADSAVFVAYTRPDETALRAVALVDGGRIAAYDGRHLIEGDTVFAALSSTDVREVVAVRRYLERAGRDHCVYEALLTGAASPDWQVWISGGLSAGATLRAPTPQAVQRLRTYRPLCVTQGETPSGQAPPCLRAELLAVSDMDGDGDHEFWHSVSYVWDSGLDVLEESASGPVVLVSACPGCAD